MRTASTLRRNADRRRAVLAGWESSTMTTQSEKPGPSLEAMRSGPFVPGRNASPAVLAPLIHGPV